MADNIAVTPGTGKTVIADEVTDGTLGTGIVQYVKLMDGAPDATGKYGNGNPLPTATFDAAAPTTVNLTAADVASTTTSTGFNGATLVTGTPTAASSNSITFNGENAVAVQLTGTWAATVVFERTIDGTNWHPATVSSSGQNYSSVTGNGLFFINAAGAIGARIRVTSFTSGTIASSIYAATGIFPVSIISAVSGMYNATLPTLSDKGVAALQLDSSGRQIITNGTLMAGEDLTNNTLGTTPKPVNSSAYAPSFYQMPGTAVTTANIKSTPGSVLSFRATNANAAVRYIQIHNTTTAPAASAVPLRSWPISAGTATALTEVSITPQYLNSLLYCSNGISFAFSTTYLTYTAATAADHFIDLNYV